MHDAIKPLRTTGAWVGSAAFALFLLGFGIDSITYMPDDAALYVDDRTRTYYPPPCVYGESECEYDAYGLPVRSRLRGSTNAAAHALGYESDPRCRGASMFFQQNRSFSGQLLVKVGLLWELPRRWNKDGSWNH